VDRKIRAGATTRAAWAPLDGMHGPMSVLPISPKAVDVFDHPGLFAVPVGRPRAVSAAAKTREPPAMLGGRARVAQSDRYSGGLHRYCSGCAQETEHVAWPADGRGSVSTIRPPATEPTIGATTCVDCGQERAAASRPGPLSWSSWPRRPITPPSLSITPDPTEIADDRASEAAAENEGMPPRICRSEASAARP
jgi:hypothetical protein